MWRRGRGYDHLFSRDSQKAERETRGERRRWDLWDCGDPRKMDRPNVGQITFFSGSTKTREGGIGQKWGWEQEVYETKYGYIGFISIPFGTYTLK